MPERTRTEGKNPNGLGASRMRAITTENSNEKVKAEARQDKTPEPTGPGGPQLEQHQPLAYPITQIIQIVTENDSRYRRPKTDDAKNLREPRWQRNNPVAKIEFKN
ncbi:hypothetical protein AVEN_144777-1 [Araneus ventricosus]|uniref:Uncharacterized protein n=1 Tax=Araneus ventricosus TaxID=182803 RepID=A0A4Y2V548_ARAVE|nr:hypothetical protein AVEN_144777-1 [Araneus ventricosus]